MKQRKKRFFAGLDATVSVSAADGGAAREIALDGITVGEEVVPVVVRSYREPAQISEALAWQVRLQVIVALEAHDSEEAQALALRSIRCEGEGFTGFTPHGGFTYPAEAGFDVDETALEVRSLPGVRKLFEVMDANTARATVSDHERAARYMGVLGASPAMRTLMTAMMPASERLVEPSAGDYREFDRLMAEIAGQPGVVAAFKGGAAQPHA